MKNKFVLLRMNSDDVAALRERAIVERVSVSHLIREAVYKKYKLKGDKIKTLSYKTEKRPGRPQRNWSDQEVAILVKLYQPAKRGSKKAIAERLGRSVHAVKHKVHTLQLNRIA